MGRRTQIALVFGTLGLALASVGAYAVDAAQDDTIADGVTVAGIDVGGLDRDEARAKLTRHLVADLERPVEVHWHEKLYRLQPQKLAVRADVDGMVDSALEESREGGIPGRLLRSLTGGEVDHDVQLSVAYSRAELDDYIELIASDLDRDPVDASVEPTSGSLYPVPGQAGIEVDRGELRHAIEQALVSPGGDRELKPQVTRTEPKVTTAELAAKYPHYIVVDRANFRLRYYRDLELYREYTVAIGAIGFDTPAGLYHIQDKAIDPTWNVPDSDWAGELAGRSIPPGPENPLKARWMGIYNGAGIHGTDDVGSLGSAASHGCVRMSVADVTELYDLVPTGTPIYIG